MQHLFSMHASAHSNNYRQAYVLLLLGFVFLTLAWPGMFHSFSLGVLLFGLGMLAVGLLNPRRFLSAGWLMTSLGVATFLMFRHSIPDSQVLTAHLLAIGLGLLGIAWMARRSYIRAGALTPGFFVVGVGVTEYLQAGRFNHTPKRARKLLLHKRQINKLIGAVEREGMTLVPLKLYFNDKGRAKVELALARGKKLHDKRETEKKRSWERERGRLLRAKG